MALTKKQARDAITAAEVALGDARAAQLGWSETLHAARRTLAQTEEQTGDVLLDQPGRAAEWPKRMRELRDEVTVAERALAAQEGRVRAAEQAWCRAQADQLELVEVVPARAELEAHQARTAELLAALTDHEGAYVPEVEYLSLRRTAGYGDVPAAVAVPKSRVLASALALAEVRHRVLVAMAAGEDPAGIVAKRDQTVDFLDCYPDVVRAGGRVVAPELRSRAQDLVAQMHEVESLPEVFQAELEALEAQVNAGTTPRDAAEAVRLRREQRLEELPGELASLQAQLVALSAEEAA